MSSWYKEEVYRFGEGFCQVCTEVDFGVFQNLDKKNLKRVAWGLDVGHKDRSKIKSLVFVFAFF